MAMNSHQIPNPQNNRLKTKKGSFTVTNDEFIIKLFSATIPAPIGPSQIQIVGASKFGIG